MEVNQYEYRIVCGNHSAQTKKDGSCSQDQDGIRMISLSQEGIQLMAFWSRFVCGCGIDGGFNPVYVMENVIPRFDSSYNYTVVGKEEWQYASSVCACYVPVCNTIFIRSDVYEGAMSGNPMDVITITHEIVHYIQLYITRFLSELGVDFDTVLCRNASVQMQLHEEQTDKIVLLILRPERLFSGMSSVEIVCAYIIRPLILRLFRWLGGRLSDFGITDGEPIKNKFAPRTCLWRLYELYDCASLAKK